MGSILGLVGENRQGNGLKKNSTCVSCHGSWIMMLRGLEVGVKGIANKRCHPRYLVVFVHHFFPLCYHHLNLGSAKIVSRL